MVWSELGGGELSRETESTRRDMQRHVTAVQETGAVTRSQGAGAGAGVEAGEMEQSYQGAIQSVVAFEGKK